MPSNQPNRIPFPRRLLSNGANGHAASRVELEIAVCTIPPEPLCAERKTLRCGRRAHFRDTCGVPLGAGAHFDHAPCSYSVAQADHAFGLGAMLAAEKCAFLFEPVTDDMNTAISADRSERMDRTLKAIEGVGPAVHAHLKRFVVVISARFTLGHDCRHSVEE